jgi:hypothetical protein
VETSIADAALATVGVLDERVPVGIEANHAHVDESALGVAAHRVFDLDDIGTPVRQDRRRCRDEGELRDLQDANALHDLAHLVPSVRLPATVP